MNGVEILATKEVVASYSCNEFDTNVFWFIFLLFTILITISFGIVSVKKDGWSYLISGIIFGAVVGAIAGAFIGTVGALTPTQVEYETQYKVTVSEDVDFSEFLDKYEILDQEGKIYTVKERE